MLSLYETSWEEIETLLQDNQKVTFAFRVLIPADGEDVFAADLKSVFLGSVEDFRGLEAKYRTNGPQSFRCWQREPISCLS